MNEFICRVQQVLGLWSGVGCFAYNIFCVFDEFFELHVLMVVIVKV